MSKGAVISSPTAVLGATFKSACFTFHGWVDEGADAPEGGNFVDTLNVGG